MSTNTVVPKNIKERYEVSSMKKNFFTKSMSALLVLIMVMSVMVVLPISANDGGGDADTPVYEKPIPYDIADSGDKLYTMNFNDADMFVGDYNYDGENRSDIDVTPNADGSAILIKGDEECRKKDGSGHHRWGGTLNNFDLPKDAFITLVYKVRTNNYEGDRQIIGKDNSISVGCLVYGSNVGDAYMNYGNYNTTGMLGETGGPDDTWTGKDVRRWKINASTTAIGKTAKVENGEVVPAVDTPNYTYFKELDNKNPLEDADGFMTSMIEYDTKNGKIYTYYLITGTGAAKSDWQLVQVADYTPAETDKLGYMMYFGRYKMSIDVKDVEFYKGTYYQNTPVIEIGTADQLAALNTTLADAQYATATTIRVKLTADIDMQGKAYTPVRTNKTIQFNGANHVISNLTVGTAQVPVLNAGLFATAGKGSTFRNFMLENVAIYGTEFTGAVIANPVFGDLTITNVFVDGTVTDVTSTFSGHVGFAGGLVGGNDYFKHTDANSPHYEVTWKFAYCANLANVTAPVSAAGIVGASCGAINYDVDYCANMGTITNKGLGAKNSDNQSAGLINARHHGYSNDYLDVDGSFRNCFNMGKLVMEGQNELTTYAGTAGIMGLYRVYGKGGEDETHENTLEFYNCFDYSQRQYPAPTANDPHPASHAAIAVWTAKTEIPMTYYTNCYAANAVGSPMPYDGLHGTNVGATTLNNAAVVESWDSKIVLTTGAISLGEMIERLAYAIETLTEVVMPLGGFDDGKDRDYTWYYANDALVEGKGTKDAPYEITNEAQFAALSALTNGTQDPYSVGGVNTEVVFENVYFKLTADLDLNEYIVEPLLFGDGVVFDGNGKTISNWTIENVSTGAMFGELGADCTVKGLTFDAVTVDALGASAIVVSTAKAGLTVSDITVKDTCVVNTAGDTAAGIVAYVLDEEATNEDYVKISFCINEADVSGKQQVGGIVGRTQGVFNYQISYCVNKGDLTATQLTNGTFYVGGILGYAARGVTASENWDNKIQNCYNTGKLTTGDTNSNCFVGGIVGYVRGHSPSELIIDNCYDVSARKVSTLSTGTKLRNGGIGGHGDANSLLKNLYNCYAMNVAGSEGIFTKLVAWEADSSALDDGFSKIVTALDAEIVAVDGSKSTMTAEMAKIDAAIANRTEIEWDSTGPCDHMYDNNCDTTCNKCGAERTVEGHKYDNDQDATCNECGATREVSGSAGNDSGNSAGDTTTKPEEKKGCKSALNSTYAVIALVAVLGFAFVAKKREEN